MNRESIAAPRGSSTRRALLKTGAAGAVAGAAVPWLTRPALALSASPAPGPQGILGQDDVASAGGLSESGLERMHEIMAGYVERGAAPGLVTLVSRRGHTHVDAIGMKAFDASEPMQQDTIFRIASMSKPITAVAAMILVEECVLRLDDPVDEMLPELANRQVLKQSDGPLDETVPANRPITLRDLLTFRLGIGMVFSEPPSPIQQEMDEQLVGWVPNPQQVPEPDEWMRRLGSLPLMYQPGEHWLYNIGYDVLGVLIARASGQSLAEFMQARIFDPLGMNDTGFSVPAAKRDRLSTVYWTNFESGELELFDDGTNSHWSTVPAFQAGASGLVSTADDYLAFAQMMLNEGKLGDTRILSRPSVEVMTTDQLTPAQKAQSNDLVPGYWESHGWGFGVSIVTRRDSAPDTPGKYGWDGGFGTSYRGDPAEEMITILLTQTAFTSAGAPTIILDFSTAAYAAIED